METAVAEAVVRASRDASREQARADLRRFSRAAVEAGREESRRIVKTSRVDRTSGAVRYSPASRVLRDWYLHVYINGLRERLGQPHEPIDAGQVEETAALVARLNPAAPPLAALAATATLRLTAEDDAASATATVYTQLKAASAERAVAHASDDRFDGDEARIHILRHWHQRCYLDLIERTTGTQQPLTAVTGAEERQVALAMETRRIRRLIGRDGIPLVTAHGTALSDIDRRLAAGEPGVFPGYVANAQPSDQTEALRSRVTSTWLSLTRYERHHWAKQAGCDDQNRIRGWTNLTAQDQTALITFYLKVHSNEFKDREFDGPTIRARPEVAARRMFNHDTSLAPDQPTRTVETEIRPQTGSATDLARGPTQQPHRRTRS